MALGAGVAIHDQRRSEVLPVDETTAGQEFMRSLARQGLRVPPKGIESIPTRGTWLASQWVFAVRNPQYELVGGPVYHSLFLVGPDVSCRRDAATRSRYVTRELEQAFRRLLELNPPKTGAEALETARSFAWLSTQTHPDRLQVLPRGEVPADLLEQLRRSHPDRVQSILEQIVGPSVFQNPVAPTGDAVFRVQLCTRSEDFWGDIYFWHMEVGRHVFSASQRSIYRAPRGLD